MEKNILYYGKKEDLITKTKLRAGDLDLIYENGFLRYIQLGDHEVLRMINHAIRDHNWNTISFEITGEEIEKSDRSFSIKYTARAREDSVDFLWKCLITGDEDGTINFIIDGEALSNFKRNRIGFTVLHPIRECTGQPVKIIHPDGSSEMNEFPVLISPHQPFFDIKGMEWSLGENRAVLEFKGDIFETEDQRNWIDESYKTYCTPLENPFPVDVKKGDKVRQEILLKTEGKSGVEPGDDQKFSFSIDPAPYPLPKIGIGQSTEVIDLSADQAEKLKKISFDHYQIDLKLFDEHWKEQWERVKIEADALNLPLELSLFFDEVDRELTLFSSIAGAGITSVSMVNVFNKNSVATQEETITKVIPELRKLFPEAEIGAGTNAFFTELNRDRPPTRDIDYLVYSINPQVHAFDNDSLVECIATVPYTIKTAKAFSNNKPVNISPITFKMRWNPNATGEETIREDQLPDAVDPRQMSLFGASWVAGLLNNILPEKPDSLTFFETVGLKGIIQSDSPSFTDQFFAPARMIYPIYYIFSFILESKSSSFYKVQSSHSRDFTGLAWGKDGPDTLLLVNFTLNSIKIELPDQFHKGSIWRINANNYEKLMFDADQFISLQESHSGSSIELLPYETVKIEIE